MKRASGLCLAFALAVGCGGGGQGGSPGGAGSGAAGQGGGTGGGGQGGTVECAPGTDYDATSCFNGVVTYQVFCPPTFQTVGTCPNGCKKSGGFGNVGLSLCNPEPADGAAGQGGGGGGQGGVGQGGNAGCSPGTDNVTSTCSNGVLTVSSACPPSSSPAGTCPYGCMYPGQFGGFAQALCNPAPIDAGSCDGDAACADASDGP